MRKNITITSVDNDRLNRLMKRTGRTASEAIRRALEVMEDDLDAARVVVLRVEERGRRNEAD